MSTTSLPARNGRWAHLTLKCCRMLPLQERPAMLERRPWLRDLIKHHHLAEQTLATATRVDAGTICSIVHGNLVTHVRTAQAIVQGMNQLAGTRYSLVDVNPECYYGGLIPG